MKLRGRGPCRAAKGGARTARRGDQVDLFGGRSYRSTPTDTEYRLRVGTRIYVCSDDVLGHGQDST